MTAKFLPMLAVRGEPFDSPQHLFEVKWDGVRAVAAVEDGRWQVWGRDLADYQLRYPELEFSGASRGGPGSPWAKPDEPLTCPNSKEVHPSEAYRNQTRNGCDRQIFSTEQTRQPIWGSTVPLLFYSERRFRSPATQHPPSFVRYPSGHENAAGTEKRHCTL